ncbi:hypothetical protein P7C73_g274, partial [Tremellales sp. Uapishka_1]
MPTPTLPLLHQLLRALRIPILPPSLATTSPSLLLVVLETLLGSKLPLPHPIGLCNTASDELAAIKCILGVLADDVLGMDLTVVDPAKVVEGSEPEMAVVVMALVVVAKRMGVVVRLPSPEIEHDEVGMDLSRVLEDTPSPTSLAPPILPDVSYSSSASSSSKDVFATSSHFRPSTSMLFDRHELDHSAGLHTFEDETSSISEVPLSPISSTGYTTPTIPRTADKPRDHSAVVVRNDSNWSRSSGGTNTGRKTVLQDMEEEFGLGLESWSVNILHILFMSRLLTKSSRSGSVA